MPHSINLPIEAVKGIGPAKARILEKLGIRTIADALYYLPLRYEYRTSPKPIHSLAEGDGATVSGKIVSLNLKRGRKTVVEVVITDGQGYLKAVWFNQPFLKKTFRMDQDILVSGIVRPNTKDLPVFMMTAPEYEVLSGGDTKTVHEDRVLPIYGLTEGLSQKQIRSVMCSVVNEFMGSLNEHLPYALRQRNGFPELKDCLAELHFPANLSNITELNLRNSIYHRRMIFDELFLFCTGLAVMKSRSNRETGISFKPAGAFRSSLFKQLPFQLTNAQRRVIAEIRKDMASPVPMHRLIQGDVGCGKTLVALSAMLDAVEAGYQAALMAPTGILAGQHYLNIHRYVEGLGLRIRLLSSGKSGADNDEITEDIVAGTHALIEESVQFRNLGLVVIDEQHKFGVVQRNLLRKKGINPDVLVMTATPIPRSLALSLYGELDSSTIDEIPGNRKPVITKCMDASDKDAIYEILLDELHGGRQAYVVYPAIEESESLDLKSAVQGRDAFARKFPEFRVELLHGRMKTGDRENVMDRFKKKEIDILVSTTVIEVGVDVPNATVMLIVHAERFGLSQLHQLRGRVGRGGGRSYCILIGYGPMGDDARRRLNIMTETSDGFRIAERDLEIRGPGEFLGTRQAGLPDFRNADLMRDSELLELAKEEALTIAADDPELEENSFLKQRVDVFWKGRLDLFRTG